jgi:hypothetical protein
MSTEEQRQAEQGMSTSRILVIAGLIAAAALSRLLPHPSNFTPIGAMAIFGGACVGRLGLAMLLPAIAMLVSDAILGFSAATPIVYGCFAIDVLIGRWLRGRRTLVPIAVAVLVGSIQFFAFTNFACWVDFYPHTLAGLSECYALAIPFFQNTLAGDAFFATVLFGGLAVVEYGCPAARETKLEAAS